MIHCSRQNWRGEGDLGLEIVGVNRSGRRWEPVYYVERRRIPVICMNF